ncbi:hypothetical protein C8Q76DRAFT_697428 [Earliella scabrosa]|nr:hypothetical protein C8Q76DRAFT_697428 [Earliella scabrosa]
MAPEASRDGGSTRSETASEAPPDIILVTSDNHRFDVHTRRLRQTSRNSFNSLLPPAHGAAPVSSVTLPESSDVVDVVLHVLYGKPFLTATSSGPTAAPSLPPLEVIDGALTALIKYGAAPLPSLASPTQPLYALLLAHAPQHPIETYALAGQHALEDVAVAASAHLVSYDISSLTDDLSVQMGPAYFMRLLALQQDRLSALKHIVLVPPPSHAPTAECGAERGRLAAAWALAAAQLAFDVDPGISAQALQSRFERGCAPVASRCEECKAALEVRIGEVIEEWSAVKVPCWGST